VGQHYLTMKFPQSYYAPVDNRSLFLLTRQRLGKGIGATILVAGLSIFAICAVPTRASAANFFDVEDGTVGHSSGQSWIIPAVPNGVTSNVYHAGTVDFCVHSSGSISLGVEGANIVGGGQVANIDNGFSGSAGQICGTDAWNTNINGGMHAGTSYDVRFDVISGGGSLTMQAGDFIRVYDSGGYVPPAPADTSTHFILTTPLNNATVSSTSPVTVGAHLYINSADYDTHQ